MISFAIPNYNRVDNVLALVAKHSKDDRITEILICDDASEDFVVSNIERNISVFPKARIVTHENNLGPYGNKVRAVKNCKSDWVVLCDSDNFIDTDYIDALFKEKKVFGWNENTIYCPSFAKPALDYTLLEHRIIGNLREMHEVNWYAQAKGGAFLNTGNYFVNRKNYVEIGEQSTDFCESKHNCDVIAFNYCWIKSGKKLKCVQNLSYFHDTNSPDSIYKVHNARDPHASAKNLEDVNRLIGEGYAN